MKKKELDSFVARSKEAVAKKTRAVAEIEEALNEHRDKLTRFGRWMDQYRKRGDMQAAFNTRFINRER